MTRYSRAAAEQLIVGAQPVIDLLLGYAGALQQVKDAGDEYGAEAALLHARIDDTLAWFTDRQVRIDRLEPLALAFPSRLVHEMAAFDVWLSWQANDARIGWYYDLDDDVSKRRAIPADVSVG